MTIVLFLLPKPSERGRTVKKELRKWKSNSIEI